MNKPFTYQRQISNAFPCNRLHVCGEWIMGYMEGYGNG